MTALPPPTPRLIQRADFDQLVNIVAADLGLLPAWVKKDYWVVRVLEALVRAEGLRGRFVFKGGTSLSKAWKLIDRFSEDIDLLLTGPTYGPTPTSSAARGTVFRNVRRAIEEGTPLRLPLEGLTEEGKRLYYLRSDTHGYMRYPLYGEALSPGAPSADWVLIEAGFRGGSQPWTLVPIQSYVGEYLAGRGDLAGIAFECASDVDPVPVPVLAAERTFVEKLLAVHTGAMGRMGKLQARHYYDLVQLYRGHPDVLRCLEAPGAFRALLGEAIGVSNEYWGADLDVETINLGQSPALLPSPDVQRLLASQWREEESLYPRGQPELIWVLEVIGELRARIGSALGSP